MRIPYVPFDNLSVISLIFSVRTTLNGNSELHHALNIEMYTRPVINETAYYTCLSDPDLSIYQSTRPTACFPIIYS